MYKGFNLKLKDDIFSGFLPDDLDELFNIGENIFASYKEKIDESLESFTDEEGYLDGTALSKEWFPPLDADVFISHSHNDEDLVKILAGLLHECQGIDAFVDSCVWGYSNELLRAIDDEYCYKPRTHTYSYDMRNYSTSHVHMMLTVALTRMIYNTECLFFINTPESLLPNDVINETCSPWIYTELEMAKVLERREPRIHREIKKSIESGYLRENFSLKMKYAVDTSALEDLPLESFSSWLNTEYNTKEDALDALYKISRQRKFMGRKEVRL